MPLHSWVGFPVSHVSELEGSNGGVRSLFAVIFFFKKTWRVHGTVPIHIGLYGCFRKWWYPQIIHFNRVFHSKPSILVYPYFRKHPYWPLTNLPFGMGKPSTMFTLKPPWLKLRTLVSLLPGQRATPRSFGCDDLFIPKCWILLSHSIHVCDIFTLW